MGLPSRLVQALLDVRRFNEATLSGRVPEGVPERDFRRYALQLASYHDLPLAEFLRRHNEVPEELFPLAFIRRMHVATFDQLTTDVRARLDSMQLPASGRAFWEFTQCNLAARAGRTVEAVDSLRTLVNSESECRILDRYLNAWIWQALGRLHRSRGDFQNAHAALSAADSTLPDLSGGSPHRRRLRHDLGSLYWASGQYRRGLEVHRDERCRNAAREDEDREFLVQSHLSAAKCAIDLGATTEANEEVSEAKELLDNSLGTLPMSEAYLALFSAELDSLFGNDDEAVHLFEYAIEQFERFDPPYYPGVLDAKIGLVRFQLERGDFKRSLRRLGELLDEAERNGCIEARTRLLAYQAKLLLRRGEDPEVLRKAYDDLVTRAHLLNNPHLTMLAYADLYMFAREHLTADEQRQWLERLRGLRRVLEKSCFDELYRDYVLERYRREVEGPLDDLGIDLPESQL